MVALTAIEQQINPFPIYRDMRMQNPVYFDTQRFSWSVFRYEDVFRVLSDYNTFSSQYHQSNQGSIEQPFASSMISTDPPRHRQLRTLVTQAFTPRAVEALAPRIRSIVNEYLDKVIPGESMEVLHDLGNPLPVTVIAELMGIPVEDRDKFKQWSDKIVGLADEGVMDFEYGRFDAAVMEMVTYFMNMIELRRIHPGEDLISGLLSAHLDDEFLSLPELMGFCVLLLVAGNETTTNLIGNAMLTFIEHSGTWQRLRDQPELLPAAIEEVLRYRSPVQCMFRHTRVDTTLGGKEIPAGESFLAWIGSANHDEDQFPDADRFILDRSPNKHLAFGQGIHYCLGAPLARLEAKIAFENMLERFSDVQMVPGTSIERMPSLIVYGIRSLPVAFKKA
ncbi:MAG: cytochrome P450 [Omnitrophica WOR_2 bacterium]